MSCFQIFVFNHFYSSVFVAKAQFGNTLVIRALTQSPTSVSGIITANPLCLPTPSPFLPKPKILISTTSSTLTGNSFKIHHIPFFFLLRISCVYCVFKTFDLFYHSFHAPSRTTTNARIKGNLFFGVSTLAALPHLNDHSKKKGLFYEFLTLSIPLL